jgi:hypothetical protein
MQLNMQAQVKSGLENYHSISAGSSLTWMPVLHYVNKHRWYTEARYNYEDINTGSVYVGKNISGGKKMTYTLTPMAGIIFGQYKGFAAAMNFELSCSKLFFSGQFQYSINKTNSANNYFYNWSELSWQFYERLYGGLSIQQTAMYRGKLKTSAGLLIGFEAKQFTIPVYLFDPLSDNRNLVVGLNVEWN